MKQATGKKLDGTMVASKVRAEITQRVAELRAHGIKPGLATVLVGDDPASRAYVSRKHKDCEEVGIVSIRHDLPTGTGRKELEKVLDGLNADPEVSGYLVQLPLPEHLDTAHVLERIDPQKDADGLHPMNLGRLAINVGDPMVSPLPCTPRGIVELLAYHNILLAGKNVLMIGRGLTVGRPLGLLLTRKAINATVTLAHTGTPNIPELLSRADVVIAAAGFPRMVKATDIKLGAIVLDVGVTRMVDEKTGKATMVGDVDPDVSGVAAWISPNPGGVGPMTRAMLLMNVVEAAERRMEKVPARH